MKDKETAQEAREGIRPALSKEYGGGKVVFCLPKKLFSVRLTGWVPIN